MSHEIGIWKPKHAIVVDGETYSFDEEELATHGVTYNYGSILWRILGDGGITKIYGLTGKESIPILENAISQLGDDVDPDYFVATEGNVKADLCILLEMAKKYPYGTWDGD